MSDKRNIPGQWLTRATYSPLLAFADTHCCSRYGTLLTYREKIRSISPG